MHILKISFERERERERSIVFLKLVSICKETQFLSYTFYKISSSLYLIFFCTIKHLKGRKSRWKHSLKWLRRFE
jgi:hypothetical protein